MKNFFLSILILLPLFSLAQSVGIGTQTPHESALLDVESTSKGLLIPRLTTLQRTTIAGAAIGLTVFDSDTYSFWVYRGDVMGGWRELLMDFDKRWELNGANIYNLNSGNVGIGTNSPTEKLTLNAPDATMQFMNSGTARGYLQTNGADIRMGTYINNTTGNLVFNTKAVDRMWIDENGRVGIGTASPASLLTINGTNPFMQFQHNDVNTGFVQAVGVNLKVGTNSTNTTGNLVFQTKLIDRLTIDENGQVGIGTTSPTSILSINSSNPILQLKNNGVDKGFVQLDGSDIKIGTNLSNSFGSFIARTKGQDRLIVNYKGQMGLNMVPDDFTTTFSIAEDENNNSGISLYYGGQRKASFSYNGTNSFITAGNGSFYIYRNSSYPIILHPDGNYTMGGYNTANGYRLSIYGKAIATEFTALPYGSWPDYVFADNYNLKSLKDVKKFISENKHLPNIPSASEIEKNGIQLGEMTKRLMEKVEELTLYIIDLQEQMDTMKKNREIPLP